MEKKPPKNPYPNMSIKDTWASYYILKYQDDTLLRELRSRDNRKQFYLSNKGQKVG